MNQINADEIRTFSAFESSPDLLGGTPVFVGTRVPIANLMDHLEAGDSLNEFLSDFPSVTREQAIAVLEEDVALFPISKSVRAAASV